MSPKQKLRNRWKGVRTKKWEGNSSDQKCSMEFLKFQKVKRGIYRKVGDFFGPLEEKSSADGAFWEQSRLRRKQFRILILYLFNGFYNIKNSENLKEETRQMERQKERKYKKITY